MAQKARREINTWFVGIVWKWRFLGQGGRSKVQGARSKVQGKRFKVQGLRFSELGIQFAWEASKVQGSRSKDTVS